MSTTPDKEVNKLKPYFWHLSDEDGRNECSGWAVSPEAAWREAYDFHRSFKYEKVTSQGETGADKKQ